MKRLIGVVLSVWLIIIAFGTPVFSEGEFEGREEEFQNLCSNWTTYNQNKETCIRFKAYLEDKRKETQKELDNLKGSIVDIKGTLEEDNATLRAMQEEISSLNQQMSDTIQKIADMGVKIETTTAQIVQKETEIAEKETKVSTYMINLQGSMRVNSYVEFVMGSKDFADVSRRLAGINSINEYNQKLIQQLNEEKLVLEDTKKELEFDKENLTTLQADQEAQMAHQTALRSQVEKSIVALERAYSELMAQQAQALESERLAKEKIESITPVPPSAGGLIKPIRTGYYVSAVQWAYPSDGDGLSGQKHMGADLAGSIGTPIIAPANGLVIASNNTCSTTGSFGCGYGFGNFILMILNVDGKIYGALFGHMQSGSITVSRGQQISQGQRIGSVGSSGNSTGPHLHAELYYLGNDSVQAAYDRWYDRGANITFNTYSAGYGPEYSYRCYINGNGAPCRLDAAQEFGLVLGRRY